MSRSATRHNSQTGGKYCRSAVRLDVRRSQSHELCTKKSWVNPLNLALSNNQGRPTPDGQRAIEKVVAKSLGLP